MYNRNITVHIGLHKTGTTFLQTHIFTKIESLTIIRAWFTHRNITNLSFKDNILITDEGISGDPWKGNYFNDFKQNIKKIKHLYGDVKIIFGIRKHDEFILSLYKQYLHQKGFESVKHLFNMKNTGILKLHDLFFHQRILLLKSEFSNVFIYSQDSLKLKPKLVLDSLFTFLGVSSDIDIDTLKKKENVGVYTEFQVSWLKKLNFINQKLIKTPFLPSLYNSKFTKYKITPRDICQYQLKNIRSKKFELSPDFKMQIQAYYADDWEKANSFIEH